MSDAEVFLNHIEAIFGQAHEISRVESTHPGLPNVSVLVYRDAPEPGLMTVITFGLSAARHKDWKHARPELMLTIASEDIAWAHAAGWVAERFRGEHPFSYGSVVTTDGPWASDTEMNGFVVFAPAAVQSDAARIELPGRGRVQLTGIYPIHQGEVTLLQSIGFERFWQRKELDPLEPRRPDMSRQVS